MTKTPVVTKKGRKTPFKNAKIVKAPELPLEGLSALLATPKPVKRELLKTPKAKTPKAETPKAKTPKAGTPKAKTPKSETPKAKTPKAATFKTPKTAAKTPRSVMKAKSSVKLGGKTPKSVRKSAVKRRPLWSEIVKRNLNKPATSKVVKRAQVKFDLFMDYQTQCFTLRLIINYKNAIKIFRPRYQ